MNCWSRGAWSGLPAALHQVATDAATEIQPSSPVRRRTQNFGSGFVTLGGKILQHKADEVSDHSR